MADDSCPLHPAADQETRHVLEEYKWNVERVADLHKARALVGRIVFQNTAQVIHHISRSGLVWCQAAQNAGWNQPDIDEVWHCILSHHGMKEWGSPVAPQTRMAWLLHLADGLSARLDDFDKRKPFSLDPK
jgi:23S rRNA maturation-related 3'-5' exoribonuclease YhaM